MTFEYKVVPAPTRGRKVKGVKTAADRFARAVEDTINDLAEEGWEYLRTDTLPAEERQGLTGRTTVYQNLLVFRRAADVAEETETTDPVPAREPGPVTAPGPASDSEDRAEETALSARIETEIAAARAPKLPSADQAQELSDTRSGPTLSARRKDVAAE